MNQSLKVKTLGALSVEVDGRELTLPASRKTRALLAYLIVSGRTQRREALCEMFWDATDDPRGALRWSLSKIRRVLKDGGIDIIRADRDRIEIDFAKISLDINDYKKKYLGKQTSSASLDHVEDLKMAASQLSLGLLAGSDLSNQPQFQAWLTAEREEVKLIELEAIKKLALHPKLSSQETQIWSRRWLSIEPLSEHAASNYIKALRRIGDTQGADKVLSEFNKSMIDAGLTPSRLKKVDDWNYEPALKQRSLESQVRTQTIKFCQAVDGVRLAYATTGDGPPIVKAANWLNHLELDWGSPIWGDSFQALSDARTLVRYDERGNGLSDWAVDEINQAMFVRDLESVVDELNIEKFPLLGISQGCAVSIEYAVKHPNKVSGLILVSGYASGWRIAASAQEQEQREAVITLTKHGWGAKNSAYRRIFSQTFMPDASPEELDWFDEFQRQTTSAENAVKFQQAFGDIDVRDLLSKVSVPTIIFHSRYDQRISLEQGRELAIGIPNARFVPLDSKNHILLGHEPAWQTFIDETKRFLSDYKI